MKNTENLKFSTLVEMTVFFAQKEDEEFSIGDKVMTGREIAFYYIENANEWNFCAMNKNKEN